MKKNDEPNIEFDVKKYISIKGAKVHNLKNIDLVLPKNKLIVLTGVSGSGKSSLAFDTLYAEGQRLYVESLSAYSRQFLERMEKPDVDSISGICPAISIEQKTVARNPRSTVGTTTEIYDYLRLLFARIGITICRRCGREIKKDSTKTVLDFVFEDKNEVKCYILFPLNKYAGRSNKEKIIDLKKNGFFRFFYDNKIIDLNETEQDFSKNQNIYVLVDRLVLRKSNNDNRYADSIETAFTHGDGYATIYLLEEKKFLNFSKKFECPDCNISYEEPNLHLFSYNNPAGACKKCNGLGHFNNFDIDKIVPHPEKSINKDAFDFFKYDKLYRTITEIKNLCRRNNIDMDIPFKELSQENKKCLILGDTYYGGIRSLFDNLEEKLYIEENARIFYKYRGSTICPACQGSRLRDNSLNIFVGGKNIRDIVSMNISSAIIFFDNIQLSKFHYDIAFRIVDEIKKRLRYLEEVGLGYITLNRSSNTLSGGESQRISLASVLGASLVGSMYVLDEPSIGLHPRDTFKLINILKSLRDLGNTVLVVEHDYDMMKAADMIVDLGPKAGEHGGEVIASGNFSEIIKIDRSLTGKYLSKKLEIKLPKKRRKVDKYLEIFNASKNNLRNVNVKIPLNMFVCVTGVSGSGKSSLVNEVLYHTLDRFYDTYSTDQIKKGYVNVAEGVAKITGVNLLSGVEMVDQTPISRTTRANPITYIKGFDIVRELFAKTSQAKSKGYGVGYFSFNSPDGQCDLCNGDGYVTIEMQFMADIVLPCESCKGKRYKNEVLDIYYNGKNISEVLDLTVSEAQQFFSSSKRLNHKLALLDSVGLGYIKLGQPLSTFSGGEAQRLKLATNLNFAQEDQKKLFIFDELTTGLHFDDIKKILDCFDTLIENGNSVLVIEHNLEVIKMADYIIDLGPEGGDEGGRIIATGSPEEIGKYQLSHTAKLLKNYIKAT